MYQRIGREALTSLTLFSFALFLWLLYQHWWLWDQDWCHTSRCHSMMRHSTTILMSLYYVQHIKPRRQMGTTMTMWQYLSVERHHFATTIGNFCPSNHETQENAIIDTWWKLKVNYFRMFFAVLERRMAHSTLSKIIWISPIQIRSRDQNKNRPIWLSSTRSRDHKTVLWYLAPLTK